MRLKHEPWSRPVILAERIVHGRVLVADCKLHADFETVIVGDYTDVPCRVTLWVFGTFRLAWCLRNPAHTLKLTSKIASLIRGGVIQQSPEIVELLRWVGAMDVDSHSLHLVHAVLHREETTVHRLLVNAHVIPQTPTKHQTIRVEVIHSRSVVEIERFDLTVAGGDVHCLGIDIGYGATSNNQHSRHLLR